MELKKIAAEIRGKVVELSHSGRTPHLGSSLSCADIIAALYWDILKVDPRDPENCDRDRFILSKGHAVTTLYVALAMRGFFPESEFNRYSQLDSCLPEHPSPNCVPGIELATGSLGHGLSVGLGIAMANRIQGNDGRVFVLLSDGECNEGSIWEAALLAPAQKLERLCVLVDFNKWQATGRSEEVTSLEPFEQKFSAFGWESARIDGHDTEAILEELRDFPRTSGKPLAIICDTIKGKGIAKMEDDNNWHYRIPTAEEVVDAKRELALVE